MWRLMSKNRSYIWPLITVLVCALMLFIALPEKMKQFLPGWVPNPGFHLGLDLAGGTQLDFRISEQEIKDQIEQINKDLKKAQAEGKPADEIGAYQLQLQSLRQQQESLVEAIRTVLTRRINSLGVSEASVIPSVYGGEKHLLVECPGIIDPDDCRKTVGKTINLEFKEEHDAPTEEHEQDMRAKAAAAMKRITGSGDTLAKIGEDLSADLSIKYFDERPYFENELPQGLISLWNIKPEDGVKQIEGSVPQMVPTDNGGYEQRDYPGIFLAEATRPKTQTGQTVYDPPEALGIIAKENQLNLEEHTDRLVAQENRAPVVDAIKNMSSGSVETATEEETAYLIWLDNYQPGTEEMAASHILVAYAGAERADETVTRTKEEAQAKAEELLQRLREGADFNTLAKEESDGPSAEDSGSLGYFGRGAMAPTFEDIAFALAKGEISGVVETPFGFHIIRSDDPPLAGEEKATYQVVAVTGENAGTRADQLKADIENGNITRLADVTYIRMLFFSFTPSGWKDTSLDGKHFRSATVTLDGFGKPAVQILFDQKGGEIFAELTRKNIGKPLAIFVGGELVSAPRVNDEITGGNAIITGQFSYAEARQMAQDLNTGAIPAPIYLAGQRTVEATLGDSALTTSLEAALTGVLILMVYMLIIYRLPGLVANISLIVYAIIFTAILKLPLFLLSDQYIVLTLAGMAGIILSVGMAVDANVLIFERAKEELRKGKLVKTSVETGFLRAWPSIRDGNFSTIITCIILFSIGTSIVKGFAVTLGMGVLISMFSAIVITRWVLKFAVGDWAEKHRKLFCG